jgi:hypothetical protein
MQLTTLQVSCQCRMQGASDVLYAAMSNSPVKHRTHQCARFVRLSRRAPPRKVSIASCFVCLQGWTRVHAKVPPTARHQALSAQWPRQSCAALAPTVLTDAAASADVSASVQHGRPSLMRPTHRLCPAIPQVQSSSAEQAWSAEPAASAKSSCAQTREASTLTTASACACRQYALSLVRA